MGNINHIVMRSGGGINEEGLYTFYKISKNEDVVLRKIARMTAEGELDLKY